MPHTPKAMATICSWPPRAMSPSGTPAATAVRHDRVLAARWISQKAAGSQAIGISVTSVFINPMFQPANIHAGAPSKAGTSRRRRSFKNKNMKKPPRNRWSTTMMSWSVRGETRSDKTMRTGYATPDCPSARSGVPPMLYGFQNGAAPERQVLVSKIMCG